jgi:hypothetical protein
MANTPNERPAKPDMKAAVAGEIARAMETLGARPSLARKAAKYDTDVLLEIMSKLGGKSDLLAIIGRYHHTMDAQWVLNELRRWNTGPH